MKGAVRRKKAICSFVPDYIWQHAAKHGTEEERERALANLALDHSVRTARLHVALALADGRVGGSGSREIARLRRAIYDAGHRQRTENLPVVRAEGNSASKDSAVNEAYDGLGAVYQFFDRVYRRKSIDGKGMELDGVVHFGRRYDNAMWDGERMIFGDGDGRIFKRFTGALDVIGHELTHGVTQSMAGLEYEDESGALNESISDVFGSLVKQYHGRQTAEEADWLIGAEVIGPAVKGKALRSMAHPGTAYTDLYGQKDPQPGHMRDYVDTPLDNGGVHINSGIPNRAFFLVASELGGFAWERAGRIWYQTLRCPMLVPQSGFTVFSALSLAVAMDLYGVRSREAKVVRHAWQTVGLHIGPALTLAA